MEIIANNIVELDVCIFICVSRELSEIESKNIQEAMEAWCLVAFSGAFEGPLHNFTHPEYEKENGWLVFKIDAGSMNPMDGFELLKGICEGLNKFTFREELISHIELNGDYEND
jgi:hypothetical protein